MTTYWVVRSRSEGYLLDTCAGGVFSGAASLAWEPAKVVAEVLTWSNAYDALAAIDAAEIERSDDLDVFPIDA